MPHNLPDDLKLIGLKTLKLVLPKDYYELSSFNDFLDIVRSFNFKEVYLVNDSLFLIGDKSYYEFKHF